VNFWIEQGDSHPANGARDFVGFRCAKSWAAAEEGRIRERAISKSCKDDESRSKLPFARWLGERRPPYAILIRMQSPLKAPSASTDPKSVQVNLTAGTGMEIEWRDGHRSSYSFPFLRDACPCALCEEERGKSRREPGDPPKLAPGALPMFKAAAKPLSAEGVGKYAIKFNWNDAHDLGIYSWGFLREVCPCAECKAARAEAG